MTGDGHRRPVAPGTEIEPAPLPGEYLRIEGGAPPLEWLRSDGHATVPRPIIRRTHYDNSGDFESVTYNIPSSLAIVDDRPAVDTDRDIIGFAEVPPHTKLGHFDDSDEMVETVEAEAVVVCWKPSGGFSGVIGEMPESEEGSA
jgi:hypothetical protein